MGDNKVKTFSGLVDTVQIHSEALQNQIQQLTKTINNNGVFNNHTAKKVVGDNDGDSEDEKADDEEEVPTSQEDLKIS